MEKTKLSFKVLGMTCTNCANIVEKALKQIPQVEFASVNLSTSTAFIVAKEEIPFEVIRSTVEKVGYEASLDFGKNIEAKRYQQARNNLVLSWLLTIPLIVLMIQHMVFQESHYFSVLELLISAIIIFLIGRKTFKSSIIAMRHKHMNMDCLIVFGSASAWLTGILKLFGFEIESFAAIGAMIMTFHLTGRFIESYLRDKASKQIESLLRLKVKEVVVLHEGKELIMPVEAVKEGSVVLVKPGDVIPVDGIVLEGQSWVDQSLVSGESIPVLKTENQEVVGGTMNLSGILKIKTTKVGKDSFLEQMLELVQFAQGSKIPIQALVDRITAKFVPFILFLSAFTFAFWIISYQPLKPYIESLAAAVPWLRTSYGATNFAIFAAISTVVIACPCALGLATPMALMIGTTVAAKKGILIRNAEVIQTSKDIKVVLFDKTGTLTEGKLAVVHHDLTPEDIVAVASIERFSNHPLAKAISTLTEKYVEVADFIETPGEGVQGIVNGRIYSIGKPKDGSKYFNDQVEIIVEVRKDGQRVGVIRLKDVLRSDARIAINELKKFGVKTVLISGDNHKNVEYVSKELGIDEYYSEVKPDEKLSIVRNYQARHGKVAMVGDGINDAASIKGADVGIAVASATDLALTSADAVIIHGGLQNVSTILKISRKVFSTIKYNLLWAFVYNVMAIPAAMMGLLHPLIAELAMIMSSVTVILNSIASQSRLNNL